MKASLMRSLHRKTLIILLTVAGGLVIGICLGGLLMTEPTDQTGTGPVDGRPPVARSPLWMPSAGPSVVDGVMPSLVGMRLPDARLKLAGPGFTQVNVTDATGQGRPVLEENNWIVAGQEPAAGQRAAVSTVITLQVRKPTDGVGAGEVTKGVVPAVICQDLQKAQDALRQAGFYNLRSEDGTGQGRFQAIDRNWLVVDQSVPGGTSPDPLTNIVLTVVKYGEPTGSSGCAS
jgi:PASTA domain